LATGNEQDIETQIEWLEAVLYAATVLGYDHGMKDLMQADQIKNTLAGKWPTNPDDVYRLACFLMHQVPVLEESADVSPPAADSAATSPTNP
jgi:hypothetical protein